MLTDGFYNLKVASGGLEKKNVWYHLWDGIGL